MHSFKERLPRVKWRRTSGHLLSRKLCRPRDLRKNGEVVKNPTFLYLSKLQSCLPFFTVKDPGAYLYGICRYRIFFVLLHFSSHARLVRRSVKRHRLKNYFYCTLYTEWLTYQERREFWSIFWTANSFDLFSGLPTVLIDFPDCRRRGGIAITRCEMVSYGAFLILFWKRANAAEKAWGTDWGTQYLHASGGPQKNISGGWNVKRYRFLASQKYQTS